VRRLALLILARTLAAFLAVQVADTPIFCADERPGGELPSASSHATAAAGDLHTSPEAPSTDAACCFCPCHLTFDSERSVASFAAARPTASPRFPLPAKLAAPAQSLDHPPQNIG
jgi:hypothetical protein